MPVGIRLRKLDRVGRRINDAHIHTARLVLERAAVHPRHAHHVAKCGENYVRILRHRKSVIDAAHRQNANRAARPVNQLNIFGKNVFQAEAIDRMGVAAANFHQAVMPRRIGQAADFVGRFIDQFGFAEFVNEFHEAALLLS